MPFRASHRWAIADVEYPLAIMRVFLTGATGYVGSAILDALLRGGHQVTALIRDPEKADAVAARGV